MKKHFQRVASLALCLVLIMGAVLPVANAENMSVTNPAEFMSMIMTELSIPDGPVLKSRLQELCNRYNTLRKATLYVWLNLGDAVVTWSVSDNAYRMIDSKTNKFITGIGGSYPFSYASGDVPGELGADTPAPPSISRNQFVNVRSLVPPYVVISYTALSDAAIKINEEGIPCTIKKVNNTQYAIFRGTDYCYANSKNQPFVAVDDRSVTNVDFDYIYNDNSTDNSQHLTVDDFKILDINNNTMNLVNDKGQTTNYNIESLYYDASTKSYTANVYDVVYNTTNNYYEYNYYTYNISYNITNTYVTYIGSTAEYTEPYEYYFELPDGRSSADMTAEEVEGISLAFDVCNYNQVATDTHTQALYHFDGSWADSSYYREETSFSWSQGASITYLDSNAFDGCLYLDALAHRFDIKPKTVSGDATVQFRLYCGGGTGTFKIFMPMYFKHYRFGYSGYTTNDLGYVEFGCTNNVLTIKKISFYGKDDVGSTAQYSKTVNIPIPVGNWADIAFSFCDNTLYIFVNGVCAFSGKIASTNDTYTFTPYFSSGHPVSFSFSSGFQFNYLDELRIVDFAVYTANYQPSPVPFDTNNVFVLPETKDLKDLTIAVQSAVPVAGYRVGGVRPTFPDRGMVYLPVENGRAIDCQIYNGTNWESVECRLWTGSRWIPMWAFDILTLSDCWDVADGTGTPPITTEQGFWSWWQKEWTDFRSWLSGVLGGGGSGGGSGGGGGDGTSIGSILGKILEGIIDIAADVIGVLVDIVLDLFKAFVSALSDLITSFVSFIASAVGNLTGFLDFSVGLGGLLSGTFVAMPVEVKTFIVGAFSLLMLAGVLKLLL